MTPEDVILSDLPMYEMPDALRGLPDNWVRDLSQDFVEDHAAEVDRFFRRVIPQLPATEGFEMAYQCQSHYLLGLAYLDSVDVAAKLLVDSTHRLLARVADALAGTEYLAYGPDAGVSQRTYERFLAAADQLRDIDLTIEPAPPVVLDSAADVGQVMTVSAVRPQ